MADTEIKLGPERLVIKDDMVTVKVARSLQSSIKKAREDYHEELNKKADQINEVLEKFAAQLEQKADETEEAYKKRVEKLAKDRDAEVNKIAPEGDNTDYHMDLAFRFLSVVAGLVGQPQKVTTANFEAASWPKVKMELAKLLLSNQCSEGDLFLPPREIEQS